MRIKTNINFNTKFSELTTNKNCVVDIKKNYKFDLGVKGLTRKTIFNQDKT